MILINLSQTVLRLVHIYLIVGDVPLLLVETGRYPAQRESMAIAFNLYLNAGGLCCLVCCGIIMYPRWQVSPEKCTVYPGEAFSLQVFNVLVNIACTWWLGVGCQVRECYIGVSEGIIY